MFQIIFTWQDTPHSALDFDRISSERIMIEDSVSSLDISFYMWEGNNRIEGKIEFNTDIPKRESIVHLKNNFIQILHEVVLKQNIPISIYDYLSKHAISFLEKFQTLFHKLRK